MVLQASGLIGIQCGRTGTTVPKDRKHGDFIVCPSPRTVEGSVQGGLFSEDEDDRVP